VRKVQICLGDRIGIEHVFLAPFENVSNFDWYASRFASSVNNTRHANGLPLLNKLRAPSFLSLLSEVLGKILPLFLMSNRV